MTVFTTMDTPLGELLLIGEPTGVGITLTSLSMPGQRFAPAVPPARQRGPRAFAGVTGQLEAYFAGEPITFDVAFTPGGTEFQQRVWRSLETIPPGSSTTYGKLAARLGLAREHTQALGAAIGANPLLLVRPCHRVIGADGGMRGYAGGVERKVWLLTHEGVLQPMLC